MTLARSRLPAALLIVLGLAAGLALPAPAKAGLAQTGELCATPIRTIEAELDLPGELLMAVALLESGRWDREAKRTVPWPWTVYAEGRDRYFDSKEAAIAEVARLRAKGVANIDVGCMQINLYHHPDAFADLDEAFAPEKNVEYAARFLVDLFEAKRSWAGAVAAYHSSTPRYAKPYKHKFIAVWNDERRRMNEVRRMEKVAELQKRRAEQEKMRAERAAAEAAARTGSS